MAKRNDAPDYLLFIYVILLLAFGLLIVYSASVAWATERFQDPLFFVKRQLFFATLGLIAMIVMMRIHHLTLYTYAKVCLFVCFILLLIVLIPNVGLVRGGARSWLGVGAFSIQPSEFMKIGMIIFLAKYLADHQRKITSFTKGLLPSLGFVILAFALIMLQPDLGTGAVMVATSVVMVFVAGARLRHFMMMGVAGMLAFAALIISAPYRIKRITSFLDPWSDPLETGFQIIQSLYAVGPGLLMGIGLGESRQKYFYLPEPQTDFIFSILAEELGFIGGLSMLLLFCLLFMRGVKISLNATSTFGSLLAIGITSMIAIQVMINIGVVIGLIPVTGITLPLISYGGSSLTLMLFSLGILLNISRQMK